MCVFGGGVGAAPGGPVPGRTSILQLVALRGPDFGQWLLLAVAGAALNSGLDPELHKLLTVSGSPHVVLLGLIPLWTPLPFGLQSPQNSPYL